MILMEEKIGDWRVVIHCLGWDNRPVISLVDKENEPIVDHESLMRAVKSTRVLGIFRPLWIDWKNQMPDTNQNDYPTEVWNLACEMIGRMKKLKAFE